MKGHDKTYQRIEKALDILIVSSVFFAVFFSGLYLIEDAEAHKNYKLCVGIKCYHTEGHRTMTTGTQQVIERIRGGEYQIGRGLEEGCDYTEAYAKHQVGWVTCRNSEAYAREFTCYQRPIEYNNGSCGAWWRSLPRRAGVPMGAN